MGVAPTVLVTVPVIPPVVDAGVRTKLMFGVVLPAVTEAVCVWTLKPVAAAVRVWLPGVSPDRVYAPAPSVVALAPPGSLTVAPEIGAPPEALVTDPVIEPGVAVRLKLALVVVPAVTDAVCVAVWNPVAEAPTVCVPGLSP